MKYEESYDEELRYKEEWDRVRIRNLKINICKKLIQLQCVDKKNFSKEELRDLFAFKEYDFVYLVPRMFEGKDDCFILTEEIKDFIDKVVQASTMVEPYLTSAESNFIRVYGSYRDEVEGSRYTGDVYKKYHKMFDEIKELLPILHWGYLPVFNRYLLYNREVDPEVELVDFYNHPDCLNALLSEIHGDGYLLSNKSDETLNKEMCFKVYTRRWGHNDTYRIRRTIDGWKCNYLAIGGDCKKDGNGGLFDNLKHDGVFFPQKGVEYALRELWDAADDGEIDFDELSKRLQEVADWISAVEKSITAQPDWVNYY